MSAKPKNVMRQPTQRAPRARLDSIKNPQPRPVPQATRPAKAQLRRPAVPTCTNKTCPKSDVDEDDGKLVCKTCGVVISDIQIIQEITFGESSNGAAVVQGAYVGANEEHARNSALGNSKLTGGTDSREVTLRNGKMAIQRIANGVSSLDGLNLTTTHHDRALSVYTLAIGVNFIQGREIDHVAAACLYIACRRDPENRVMLIDFSDTLKVDVFKLGHTYNSLVQELGLRKGEGMAGIGEINPEHLIYRFAGQLDFGDDYIRVANEAAKILQRMRRDWMAHGRRPSGVCGAALILAARMNNYRRTVREVVYIAKVTDLTINKRLEEFKYTQSSALTVAEFRNHGLQSGQECDPPAYYRQFLPKKKRKLKKNEGTAAEEISDSDSERANSNDPSNDDDDDENTTPTQQAQRDSQAMPPPPIPIDPALHEVSAQRLSELESSNQIHDEASGEGSSEVQLPRKSGRPPGSKNKPLPTPTASQIEDEDAIESDIDSYLQDPATVAHATELHNALNVTRPLSPPSTQGKLGPRNDATHEADNPLDSTEPNSPPATQRTEALASTQTRPVIPDTEIIPEEEFAGDPEIDNCLLTDAEIKIKERIWVHENGDYLRAQQARLIKQQLAEANGTARVIVRRKRKRGRMGDVSKYQTVNEDGQVVGPSTPEEAVAAMMKKRGYSRKINYQAIKHHFASSTASQSRATSTRDSVVGDGDEEQESRAPTPLVTVTSPTPPTAGAEKAASAPKPDKPSVHKDRDAIVVDDVEEDEDAAGPVPETRRTFGTVDPDAVSVVNDNNNNDELMALAREAQEGTGSGEDDYLEEEYEDPPPEEEDD